MEQPPSGRGVGIEVAQAPRDVAIRPDDVAFGVANDAAGWRQLVDQVDLASVVGIVLEVTGGYHQGVPPTSRSWSAAATI